MSALTAVPIVWVIGTLDDNLLHKVDTNSPVHTLPKTQTVHYFSFLLDTSIWEILCFRRRHRRPVCKFTSMCLERKPTHYVDILGDNCMPTNFPVHALPEARIVHYISFLLDTSIWEIMCLGEKPNTLCGPWQLFWLFGSSSFWVTIPCTKWTQISLYRLYLGRESCITSVFFLTHPFEK